MNYKKEAIKAIKKHPINLPALKILEDFINVLPKQLGIFTATFEDNGIDITFVSETLVWDSEQKKNVLNAKWILQFNTVTHKASITIESPPVEYTKTYTSWKIDNYKSMIEFFGVGVVEITHPIVLNVLNKRLDG